MLECCDECSSRDVVVGEVMVEMTALASTFFFLGAIQLILRLVADGFLIAA